MLVARTIARKIGLLVAFTVAVAVQWQPLARAAGDDSEEPGSRTLGAPAAAPPAASADAKESEERAPSTPAPEATAAAPFTRPVHSWGVGVRGRWVSVPGWLLGLF